MHSPRHIECDEVASCTENTLHEGAFDYRTYRKYPKNGDNAALTECMPTYHQSITSKFPAEMRGSILESNSMCTLKTELQEIMLNFH